MSIFLGMILPKKKTAKSSEASCGHYNGKCLSKKNRYWPSSIGSFLYARSIGCIGLLKLHLNQAFNLALTEGARTVTETHLRQTAPSDVRVKLALRNALESEVEFIEADDADKQLLALLGRPSPQTTSKVKKISEEEEQDQKTSKTKKRRPGKRVEGRDSVGETPNDHTEEERATG